MKKVVPQQPRNWAKIILITLGIFVFFLFLLIPACIALLFGKSAIGNVAVIPIEGVITTTGGSYLGESTTSSEVIIGFIEEANKNPTIKAIILEINSPGGTPVATDEITTAIAKSSKPVVTLIREIGASSAYWIASSTEYIVASRMSLTGSIGVISSYLEFSGLMEKYGVGYERLVAGEHKDMGIPYRQLSENEKSIMQGQLDALHDMFIKDVAANRNLPVSSVRKIATGGVFLGAEAVQLGLIDSVGTIDTLQLYLQEKYGISSLEIVRYEQEPSFLQILSQLGTQAAFSLGQGVGASLFRNSQQVMI